MPDAIKSTSALSPPLPRRAGGERGARQVPPDAIEARYPIAVQTLSGRQNRAIRSTSQTLALRDAAPDLIAEAIIVAAGIGSRQGELLGLRRRSVDFLRKDIVVVEQAVTLSRGGAEFRPPNTRQALRRIPVGDVVIDAIARHLEKYPCEPDEAIFRKRMGRLHRRSAFGVLWRKARQEAAARDTLRWHELRHFYASTLIAGGASVREVMERMGHTSAKETIARYSRLWPDRTESTRALVDSALSRGTAAGPQPLTGR